MPGDVEALLGRKEFHQSLKTHDLSEAKAHLFDATKRALEAIDHARDARQKGGKSTIRRRARFSSIDFDASRTLSDSEIAELVASWFVEKQAFDLNLSARDAAMRTEAVANAPPDDDLIPARDAIELLETRQLRCDKASTVWFSRLPS